MSDLIVRLELKSHNITNSYHLMRTTGFGWTNNKKNFIVTTHHNLPIKTINYKEKKLKIENDCYWNELLVLKSSKIDIKYYNSSLSKYEIPKKDTIISFSDISLKVIDYTIIPYNDMPNEPGNIYIVCEFVDKQIDLRGYSGCPVFENNKLIGIICKTYRDKVLILPIYYLNKIFQKDNYIYKPKVIKPDIMHHTLGIEIPFSTYYLLEGDSKQEDIISINPDYKIKKTTETKSKIIKYHVNPRFLQLFKQIYFSNRYYNDIMKKILNDYNSENENKYFICIDKLNNIELVIS